MVAAEVLLVSELNEAGPVSHLKSFTAGIAGELVVARRDCVSGGLV